MKKYELTSEAITFLAMLIGYLALLVIAYGLTGFAQQILYACMTMGSLVGMYIYVKNSMQWHMLICAVIGMMTVFAGLDSLGPIL